MLFVLVLICYGQTINYPFVYDDVRVLESPTTEVLWQRSLSPNRSVVNFTFFLNKVFFGNSVAAFRVVNIFIHLCNGFLIYLLLCAILRIRKVIEDVTISNTFVPLMSACIFVVHPLAIQSTTYLSQRFNSLAAFFFLMTVFFFLLGREKNSRGLLVISICSSLLAFLSKEFTVSLIVIIPLLEYIFFFEKDQKSKSVFMVVPFLITGLTIPVLHFLPAWFPSSDAVSSSILPTWAPLDEISRSNYLVTQINAVFTYYLYLFFMPLNLSVYPSVELVRSFKVFELVAVCLFSFMVLLSLNFIKKFPLASLGVLWFVITLAPTSSFIPNTELVSEHRFYVPSIGILLIFMEISLHVKSNIFATILVLFVLTLIPLNYFRNQVWSSEETLWLDATKKAPLKSLPHVNLAGVYLDQGKNQEAFVEAKKALNIFAEDRKALYIAGRTQEVLNPGLSSTYYKRIIDLFRDTQKPKVYYQAQMGIAILLYNINKYDESIKIVLNVYQQGFLIADCHKILAYNYYAAGNLEKALFHVKEGRRLGAVFQAEFLKVFLRKK